MVSPVLDVDVGTIYMIGEKLEQAITMTKNEVGWEGNGSVSFTESETASETCGSIYSIGDRLEQAVVKTKNEVGWEGDGSGSVTESESASETSSTAYFEIRTVPTHITAGDTKCSLQQHATRSSDFASQRSVSFTDSETASETSSTEYAEI